MEEKKNGKWVPFRVPKDDTPQVSFTMLDPWVRENLQEKTPGRYAAQFRVPDQHGVFTLGFEYKRYGWSYLSSKYRVSALPFRHDAYPRYVSAAEPYYVVMGSMIAAWILFSTVFLFTKDDPQAKPKQQ